MSELTVYNQMKLSQKNCLAVLKREIGLKTNCMPFTVKLMTALGSLNPKTVDDELDIANTLLSGLQTLMQGGIIAEDYDKIDFVVRGGKIVPSARVEAFYRACARKGYRITDTIIYVPKEDNATTFFKETLCDNNIFYLLEDKRNNPDRAMNAKRLTDKYFSKFLIRLDIREIHSNQCAAMVACEMSVDDMLLIASTSEQGLYKSHWEGYIDKYGRQRKRKIISSELADDTFWAKWTGEMVNKTLIRRALKRVKEVLPELHDSIYAFDNDDELPEIACDEPVVIDIPLKAEKVDLNNLTEEQLRDAHDVLELYKVTPRLAEEQFGTVRQMINDGKPAEEIINENYAELWALSHSKTKWKEIGGYFNAFKKQSETGNA